MVMEEEQPVTPVAPKPSKEKKKKNVVFGIIIVIAALLGFGTWYNQTHYNPTFENNFIGSCKSSGGSDTLCGCAYKELKANYPYSKAKYFDNHIDDTESQEALTSIASKCSES